MSDDRHENWLKDHERRIRSLEVNQALLTQNMETIRKLGFWAVTLLGGSFLVQLANVVMGG